MIISTVGTVIIFTITTIPLFIHIQLIQNRSNDLNTHFAELCLSILNHRYRSFGCGNDQNHMADNTSNNIPIPQTR